MGKIIDMAEYIERRGLTAEDAMYDAVNDYIDGLAEYHESMREVLEMVNRVCAEMPEGE